LVTSSFQLAAQSPDWQQPLPADTSVQTGVLPNGLRYYIRPNDEPRQRAELRLVVKAGSLQEEADQLGVAHFVEHMAFNGTESFAQNTLIDFIERNGSRFGADLNAYTSFAETVYQLEVKTDSLSLVDTALQILAEWAGRITFEQEEVDKERGVVISEWRSGLSSNQRLQQQAYQVLLPGSRYAERLPIGSPALIDTVSRQRLIDFYERWYQPENMAVIVVGDVDSVWVQEKITAYFGSLDNHHFVPAPKYSLDTLPARRYLLATDDEAAFTRWEVTFQLERRSSEVNLGTLRDQLLHSLFGTLLNKRLAALREREVPPFTFAYSGFSSLPGDYRTYRISGLGPAEQLDAAMQLVFMETRRAVLHGFSKEELAAEKKATSKQFEQMARELDKRSSARIAGNIREAALDGKVIVDLAALPAAVDEALATITPEDLQQLVQAALHSSVQTGIITTNTELATTLPDSAAFFQQLDTLLRLQPEPLPTKAKYGPLFSEKLAPQVAAEIGYDSTLQIRSFRLPNGLQLHLKATNFKNDEISFQAFSPGGTSLYEDEDYASARHAVSILDQSGLDTFRASELLQLLGERRVSVNPYLGTYEEGMSGSSNQEDLETFFQLIYLYFTRPRFDSLTLAAYQQRQIDIYERLDKDPRTAFGRMLIDKKYDNHPRRPNGSVAEMEAIDLARATAIYAERFANAADFQFVFVGNFETDSLLQLAGQYLGNLPTTNEPSEQWIDRGLRLHPESLDTTVVAGQTPKAEVILEWHGEFPYADRDARLHFSALRELLNFRLRAKLREELGSVYGVRISMSTSTQPDSLHHTVIRFNAQAEEVDTLTATIYAEIDAIANGQVLQSDIDKIQTSRLKSYEEATRSNRFWLAQIGQTLRMKYDFSLLYPEQYAERVASLEAATFSKIAQQYLREATHFKFLLLPRE
jgi:zinc protease